MGRTLKQCLLISFTLFGFHLDLSTSSPSPWKSDGGGQVKLINGTEVTQTEFDGNAYASAAMGMVVGPGPSGPDCLGALVSDKYFLYTELSGLCKAPNNPIVVAVGSIYIHFHPIFNGENYNISTIIHPPVPPLALAKISPNLTSKAKPVPLPPTSLLHTPPPVGAKCNAWGFGVNNLILNRLAVTIVSISDCKSRWGTYNSSFVFPEDNGTVFCAWVTTNGTADGAGSICFDFPSLIICEAWAAPTPPKPPSCGWHRSGGGGRRTISNLLAKDNGRAVPSYLLTGFLRHGTGPGDQAAYSNCGIVGPPAIYTYTGGVISSL